MVAPCTTFRGRLRNVARRICLSRVMNHVGTGVVLPCPPKIPLMVPNRVVARRDHPILRFLRVLYRVNTRCPNFRASVRNTCHRTSNHCAIGMLGRRDGGWLTHAERITYRFPFLLVEEARRGALATTHSVLCHNSPGLKMLRFLQRTYLARSLSRPST